MVPVGDWAKTRLVALSDTDQIRDESKVSSGFGKNVSNWVGRDGVYPTNVIHMATECGNKVTVQLSGGVAGMVCPVVHAAGRHRTRSVYRLRYDGGGGAPAADNLSVLT